MPYRASGLLMALAGLVAVAGLILIGIDVYAARQSGPRWKRRLLGAGLAVLGGLGILGASSLRSREPVHACYIVSAPGSACYDLAKRAGLLEEAVVEQRIDAATAAKTLQGIEQEMTTWADEGRLRATLPAGDVDAAIADRQAARAALDRVKARLAEAAKPAVTLEASLDWKLATDAWDFAVPFARSGKSTAAQRQEIDAKAAAARRASNRLVAAGLLSPAERELLLAVADLIRGDVLRSPPTDAPDPAWIYPGRAPDLSLRLLEAWRPAIEKLAGDERTHRAVAERVLPTVEGRLADLGAMLRSDVRLPGDRGAQARQTFDAVKAHVEKLRKLLAAAPGPAATLEASPDWKLVADAWDLAMPLARSGRSTEAQRQEVGAKLGAAYEAGARLVKAGLLSAREAELLAFEADKAAADIRRDPPVGIKCYMVESIPAVQRLSFKSIGERLPAIEDLIKAGKVHPTAIAKVLGAIEADLAALADERRRAELGDQTPKAEAEKTRGAIKAEVEKLRKLLAAAPGPAVSLEESVDWKTIVEAWDLAKPLADSGKSTETQREAADARLQAAKAAAAALAAAGLLSASEAELLAAEADKLKQDIYRNPPEPEPGKPQGRCYRMAHLPAAEQSFARLSARLPLLQRLTAESRLHRPAIDRVLASIEADVATLSDEKKLGELRDPARRPEAEKTRDAVRAEVEKLRKLLEEKRP